MTQNILIIGATSSIAEAVARLYAQRGYQLFLVARNNDKLNQVTSNLTAQGALAVHTFILDVNDTEQLTAMIHKVWLKLSHIDVALIAHGTLPDQKRCETDLNYALSEFRTNAESVIACLTLLAQRFEEQAKGTIAVIGSVAGDRGRPSNYLYGAAKATIDTFASGLRGRLFKKGVHVLTIKPGFVDTPMTQGLSIPQMLVVPTDKVAVNILKAINKKKDTLYTPWFWYWIMLIVNNVPNVLFKRTNL